MLHEKINDHENLQQHQKINEDNDLRENISDKYNPLYDLNKETKKIDENNPYNPYDQYNKNEILTENNI